MQFVCACEGGWAYAVTLAADSSTTVFPSADPAHACLGTGVLRLS